MKINLSDSLRLSNRIAIKFAQNNELSFVTAEVLLYGILSLNDNVVNAFLQSCSLSKDDLKDGIVSRLALPNDTDDFSDNQMKDNGNGITFSGDVESLLVRATIYCIREHQRELTPIHVLVAMLDSNSSESTLKTKFLNMNNNLNDIVDEYLNLSTENDTIEIASLEIGLPSSKPIFDNLDSDEIDDDETSSITDKKSKSDQKHSQSDTPALDLYGVDLTVEAQNDKLDPVIGRSDEITRVIQILSRRKKNNPVLIGEPGIGKSAIVEGLAQRIVNGQVSRLLRNKRIISLDLSLMVAGSKYRGEFEERIKAVMKELKENPDIVLFLDEIHTIIGAGAAAGSMDAANILKPALARGEVQCIGATTLDEYRKTIEKDGALERRFQKVLVSPNSKEETIEIISHLKNKYEEYHHVSYTDAAINAAVSLTDRYISDRFFPDKAIDAIDEAGAATHIQEFQESPIVIELEKELNKIRDEKKSAVNNQKYELAASFRDKERSIEEQISAARLDWSNNGSQYSKVDEHDIARVISLMTNIPIEKVAKEEHIQLRHLASKLKQKVIGQDDNIDALSKAIVRNRLGLRDDKRPIGTFMFVGPTGVGKTYLAKKLAEELFDDEESIIRVDMSEYMEKFAVSRLVGAPPGYVGYEEGGQLTEQVRRKPYSVVLLDEIEKAHPDVFNLLLQVLDDGVLTDSYGRKVSFKNTVIIITSNVGTKRVKEFRNRLGFGQEKTIDKNESDSILGKEINKKFSPEFLNRLDKILVFDSLSGVDVKKIVDLELTPILRRVKEQGYNLVVTEAAKTLLAEKSYNSQYGARPIRRTLQEYVEDALTDLIINNKIRTNCTIKLRVQNKQLKMVIE